MKDELVGDYVGKIAHRAMRPVFIESNGFISLSRVWSLRFDAGVGFGLLNPASWYQCWGISCFIPKQIRSTFFQR